jgi:glycosyltransferase involved in cell wall biosynthesis
LNIQQPSVCICIPNYNNEATISETLDSILNQTYKNIIIKIFDNSSTDNSVSILCGYAKKHTNIKVFQNATNIGGEANFTKCIQNMEGDFSAIYHADDIYHPQLIENQVKYLMENDISAIFVCANLIDSDSRIIGETFFPDKLKNKKYHQWDFEKLFGLILKYDNFLITPSCMARTEIYKNDIQRWNESVYKTSADLDVWLRFSEIKDIGLLTDKLMSYRMATSSFSFRTKFTRSLPRDMFLVIENYLQKYKNKKFNLSDYEFLKFKDHILVLNNKLLNGGNVKPHDITLMDFSIYTKAFFSKRNARVYLFAFLLKFFLSMNLRKYAIYLIKKIN